MEPNHNTVLVVEEDIAVRRLTLLVLRSHGYRILEAFDGESGFAAYLKHRNKVDLILTDVGMPVLTGPEMVEKILVLEPSAKVIFITGTPGLDFPQANGKPYRVLPKPFTPEGLASTVQQCLETCI